MHKFTAIHKLLEYPLLVTWHLKLLQTFMLIKTLFSHFHSQKNSYPLSLSLKSQKIKIKGNTVNSKADPAQLRANPLLHHLSIHYHHTPQNSTPITQTITQQPPTIIQVLHKIQPVPQITITPKSTTLL